MIRTERLELVPATPPMVRAAMEGGSPLAACLGVEAPASWPPLYLDTPALEFTLARLAEGPGQLDWWLHFVLLRASGRGASRCLIGTAGFVGPPSTDGTVEVGYSILPEHQRKGYATEAVRGMVTHSFAIAGVERVIAETLAELEPSIGVLRKCGFRPAADPSSPEVIRFELTRGMFESAGR